MHYKGLKTDPNPQNESIRSSSWKYTVFSRKLYGLLTETIRSAKVYSPQNLKVYGLIKKSKRSFSENYTLYESIRSWVIDESYDVKAGSIRSWIWLIINESFDVKSGTSTRYQNWLIISESYDEKGKVHGPLVRDWEFG